MSDRLSDFDRRMLTGASAAIRSEQFLRRLLALQTMSEITLTSRYNEPLRLLSSGYKVFSQNQEDGMIAEVFRRIGTASKRFVEFGVEQGLECNTTFLLTQGWSGCWFETSSENVSRARAAFKGYPIEIIERKITVDNADHVIKTASTDSELDLLSIDIDSLDYWVWRAITTVRPRLVVIEYNAFWPPHVRKTVALDPEMKWDGTNYFGASLGALEVLSREKGYCLVGCSLAGVNAFFVREDLVGEKFCAPFTAENHYEPARYHLNIPSGHRPGMGVWVDVA